MPEESLVPVHYVRHPFDRKGLLRRILPFVLPLMLASTIYWLPGQQRNGDFLVAALSLSLAIFIFAFILPWSRLPSWTSAVLPLGNIVIIFLLREGIMVPASMFAPLLLLPLLWLSLYGSRAQLMLGFVFATGTYGLSLFLHGHNPAELKFLAIAAVSAPVVCFTAQELVLTVRSQAHKLEALAHLDALTGAANRREWDTALPREIARAQRHRRGVAVALLDLDGLKDLNDRLGHQEGDRILKEAVAAWREHLRAGDLLARVGGDEFAVMLPECEPGPAAEIVERLRHSTPHGHTVSIGVACWDGTELAPEIEARADRALYRAKEGGKDRTVMDGAADPVAEPEQDAKPATSTRPRRSGKTAAVTKTTARAKTSIAKKASNGGKPANGKKKAPPG